MRRRRKTRKRTYTIEEKIPERRGWKGDEAKKIKQTINERKRYRKTDKENFSMQQ